MWIVSIDNYLKNFDTKVKSYFWKVLENEILWLENDFLFNLPRISNKWNDLIIFKIQENINNNYEKKWIKINRWNSNIWITYESIIFEDINEYLKKINKLKEYNLFIKNINILKNFNNLNIFELLKNWILEKNNIQYLLDEKLDFNSLSKIIFYFLNNWINNKNKFFIRELPIEVHTKFIENNKKIIEEILLFLNINLNLWYNIEWDNFENKFFLKTKSNFIRFKILDDKFIKSFHGVNINDINILIDDFEKLNLNWIENIYIVENEINYLIFPKREKSILIFWSWNKVNILKNIKWFHDINIFYWWDIDSHGFNILWNFREYFSKTKSIWMNQKIFDKYKIYVCEWKTIHSNQVENLKKNLNDDEFNLLEYINKYNLRLEQENIFIWDVL